MKDSTKFGITFVTCIIAGTLVMPWLVWAIMNYFEFVYATMR